MAGRRPRGGARAQKAREMLDEGIDPRKAGIVRRANVRTESPAPQAPTPIPRADSTEQTNGTPQTVPNLVKRSTDLSDDSDNGFSLLNSYCPSRVHISVLRVAARASSKISPAPTGFCLEAPQPP
jgi:hypothetical protein